MADVSGIVKGNIALWDYQLQLSWEATYNISTLTAHFKVNCDLYPTGSGSNSRGTTIYGTTNDNYVKINNTVVFSIAESPYSGASKSYPRNFYTSSLSNTDGTVAKYNIGTRENPNWVWCRCYGKLVTDYEFDVPINPTTGIASFTVEAKTYGYWNGSQQTIWYISNQTVTTASSPAQIYSKLPYKTNNGWDGTAYIWYKESAGASGWIRKYIYRKESTGWIRK